MKRIIILAIMITVLAGSIFAQGVPGGFVSPQNTATQGRIRSFADDFIRPDAYQNVKVEDWFGFTSFSSTTAAAIGWGTKLGGGSGPFLGLFYNGSAWANIQNVRTNEKDGITYPNPPAEISNLPSNQIAILLGLGNMGFRLSLISTYNSINQNDVSYTYDWDDDDDPLTPDVKKTDKFKSYDVGRGLISPQIAWSLTNNIIDGVGVRPWVTIDFGFNNNFSKTQYDGEDFEIINSSLNYIRPELQLGLGGIILANKNDWRTSFDLEYRLRLDLYDNEYNESNGDIAKISGRNGKVSGDAHFDEYFWMDHRIRPSISAQWNGEKLRLRSKLDLNVTLTSTDTAPQIYDNGTLKTEGNVTNLFTIDINPDLALAAQWQVTEKLFINMGGRLNLNAMRIATTNSEKFTGGTAVADSKSTETAFSFGTGLGNALSLGITLNATDNLFIEATCGVTENILTTFGGMTTFSNLLVGLKF